MNKKLEILKEINIIFCRELEDDSIVLDYASSANSIEKWDSINNLILISAIEERFDLTFPIDVIFNAQNIGSLIDFIISDLNLSINDPA